MKLKFLVLGVALSLPLAAITTRVGSEMPEPQDDGQFYHWRWGVFARFIQNDLLDVRRNNAGVRKSAFNTVLGELTLNLYDRIDLFAGVGTSKLEAITTLSSLYSSGVFRNNTVDLNFTTATAWNCGFSAKAIEWQNWYTGLGFSYFSHYPRLDYIVDNSTSTTHYLNLDAHFYAWMLSLGGGYVAQISRTFSLKPHMAGIYGPNYVTIAQHFVDLDGLTTIEISELYAPFEWGYILGVTLIGGSHFSLTAQLARVLYEGFSITGSFPF